MPWLQNSQQLTARMGMPYSRRNHTHITQARNHSCASFMRRILSYSEQIKRNYCPDLRGMRRRRRQSEDPSCHALTTTVTYFIPHRERSDGRPAVAPLTEQSIHVRPPGFAPSKLKQRHDSSRTSHARESSVGRCCSLSTLLCLYVRRRGRSMLQSLSLSLIHRHIICHKLHNWCGSCRRHVFTKQGVRDRVCRD